MQSEPLVVVTWPGFDPADDPAAAVLRAGGVSIGTAPKFGARSPAEVVELLDGAAGAIVSTDPFDRDVLEALSELRVIARVGVGTDSIDLDAATQRGVLVTTTPGANAIAVAEHTIGLMLATLRRIAAHDQAVRSGRWERIGPMLGEQLAGRTVGIVGYGSIGRAVAQRLRPFDVGIIAHDPFVPSADVSSVSLDELVARADVLSIHAPATLETRGLIDAERLAALPTGAIVISTARGGIVDEDALLEAVRSGHLDGAGLDVFSAEPPTGSPAARGATHRADTARCRPDAGLARRDARPRRPLGRGGTRWAAAGRRGESDGDRVSRVSESLRVGLFGHGRIGRVHAANIAAHPRAELVAVHDVSEAAAADAADRYGADIRAEADAIISDESIDAVVIASPTPTHVDLLQASVLAGKATLCEKPIDLDIDKVEVCREAIRGHDVPLMIGFHRRFDPSAREIHDASRAGAVGDIESLRLLSRDRPSRRSSTSPCPAVSPETCRSMISTRSAGCFPMSRSRSPRWARS